MRKIPMLFSPDVLHAASASGMLLMLCKFLFENLVKRPSRTCCHRAQARLLMRQPAVKGARWRLDKCGSNPEIRKLRSSTAAFAKGSMLCFYDDDPWVSGACRLQLAAALAVGKRDHFGAFAKRKQGA